MKKESIYLLIILQLIEVAQQKQLKGGDGDFIVEEDGNFIVSIVDEDGPW